MRCQDRAIKQLIDALRLPGTDMASVGTAILEGHANGLVSKQAGVAKAVLNLKLQFINLYQRALLLPTPSAQLTQLCDTGIGGAAVAAGGGSVDGASGSKEVDAMLGGMPQGPLPQVLQPRELLLNKFDAALRWVAALSNAMQG